jgi:hypothetical protein
LEYVGQYPEIPAGEVDMSEINDYFDQADAILKKFHIAKVPGAATKVVGFEAGDDRTDFCKNPWVLALMIVIQERVFLMKTSKYDTFITRRLFNFCEVTGPIPYSREQSLEVGKRTGMKHIGFIDVPPLRIVMNVQKGDLSHSSTEVGKASMLGLKIRDCQPKRLLRLKIASYLQDACLSTHTMKEPKYIPIEMGGCGCPSPWGDYRNLYLYMKTFKRGTYDRVYGTATNEAYATVRANDRGEDVEAVLCKRLRQRQEYLFGTYADKVLVPPDQKYKEGFPDPLYMASGTSSGISGVERRLIRAKILLTEKQARVEYDHTVRLERTILGINRIASATYDERRESTIKRKEYDGALSANAAFSRLLNRTANGTEVDVLIKAGFLAVNTGVLAFSIENAKWLHHGGKGQIFTIHDIPSSENMYIRDEVSIEKTMKIGKLDLKPIFSRQGIKTVLTRSELGLWQISGTMNEWALEMKAKLIQAREANLGIVPVRIVRDIYHDNSEWVSDDERIISRISEAVVRDKAFTTVLLVSGDGRLANQCAQTTGINVVRLEPLPLFIAMSKGEPMTSKTEYPLEAILSKFRPGFFGESMLFEPSRVFYDTGSISAELSKLGVERGNYYHTHLLTGSYENQLRGNATRKVLLDAAAVRILPEIRRTNTIKMVRPTFLTDNHLAAETEQQRYVQGRLHAMDRKFMT